MKTETEKIIRLFLFAIALIWLLSVVMILHEKHYYDEMQIYHSDKGIVEDREGVYVITGTEEYILTE